MARPRHDQLTQEELDYLKSIYQRLAERRRDYVIADMADYMLHRLAELAEDGSLSADRLVRGLARPGLMTLIGQWKRADKKSFYAVPGDGSAALPNRVSVKRKDSTGRVVFQQALWWELTWDEFETEVIGGRTMQIAAFQAVLDRFRDVLRFRAKYPETSTPGEALEREGIDPRSIEAA